MAQPTCAFITLRWGTEMGQIFATFDAVGKATGFFDEADFTDAANPMPNDAILLTEEQYAALQASPSLIGMLDGAICPLPIRLTLEEARTRKLAEINAQYERAAAQVREDVPASEIATWAKQEADARRWQVDPLASTPFVDALAHARGVDRTTLLVKIVAKADAYSAIMARLTGQRQAQEDQLATLTDPAAVAALEVVYG